MAIRKKSVDSRRDTPSTAARRIQISQSDVPSRTLRDALRVPQAIIDSYAGVPTAPHDVALALEMSPTSSGWRDLAAAAAGYGLSKGSWSAGRIAVTDLGRRATAPTDEGQEIRARAEAALIPKVFGAFFRRYDKNKFPSDHIAKNVLQQEFGIPPDRAESALRIIRDNGQFVGFVRDTKTGPFVALDEPHKPPMRTTPEDLPLEASEIDDGSEGRPGGAPAKPQPDSTPALKVFISHGRNKGLVEQVKDILTLYDIPFEVAVEGETAAIPVPEKVMSAMRRCQAGIMIVSADEQASDGDSPINTNVLIEVGAAFVLYDKRVVLLWDKKLRVPSNLQGLYRLEFEGTELSFAAGTRLAKAIKSLRE